MADKMRLDAALLARCLAQTQRQAAGWIMAGQVFVNGQRADKPGAPVKPGDRIDLHDHAMRYASRGGYKLEKALTAFPLCLTDCVCADVGASTGGFTDCMLQNGARRVYAVDVGYGLLAWKLRSDPRVVSLERTNFRHVTREQIPEPLDFASVDVSFISLRQILPVLRPLLKPAGQAVTLIKPQFEAPREEVGEKGVVRDPQTHVRVIRTVTQAALSAGFSLLGLDFSPIRGPEGNIEYLAHLRADDRPQNDASDTPEQVTAAAHAALDERERGEA